jgi:hypothetical protein
VLDLPFFERLRSSKRVLVAGAGGGFDVFAGLPICFALRKHGAEVSLANLSFSRLDVVSGTRLVPNVVEIAHDSDGPTSYFPEKYLARWFHARGEPTRIFAFEKTGVEPLKRAYAAIAKELGVDTVVLVDGGSDSLLRGDECGLGTPAEDMTSLAAVDDLDVPNKLFASIGFGIDTFHGVCHAHVLETIASLTRDGAYLGAFSLLPTMQEFTLFKSAVDAAHASMRGHESIVNSSIVSAIEGDFGDVHKTTRTRGSELFINPLMALYFTFDLAGLARHVAYLPRIKSTQTMFEVSAIIEAHQRSLPSLKPWVTIPF